MSICQPGQLFIISLSFILYCVGLSLICLRSLDEAIQAATALEFPWSSQSLPQCQLDLMHAVVMLVIFSLIWI